MVVARREGVPVGYAMVRVEETDNEWFGMTYKGAGVYTKDADLTMFGQQIVEGCTNPTPGGCGSTGITTSNGLR